MGTPNFVRILYNTYEMINMVYRRIMGKEIVAELFIG